MIPVQMLAVQISGPVDVSSNVIFSQDFIASEPADFVTVDMYDI